MEKSGPNGGAVIEGLKKLHNEKVLTFVFFVIYYWGDHIKENEMTMNGRDEKCIHNFSWKT
jgi:hypothetical protein